MTLTTSEIFTTYVNDLIRLELTRPRTIHLDALERRLWDAAAFDSYIVGRNSKPLLDGLGLPVDYASEYAAIIEAAKAEYIRGKG